MAMITPDKADASPTKAFFVNMITRDITFEDSILDLIDNSVDGAWRSEKNQPLRLSEGPDLSPYAISITATPKRFAIKDNCGGMTLDEAANYAFSFGRRHSQERPAYRIGIYGIGMKRAAFKLGTSIRIRSTYAEAAETKEAFVVPIEVKKWLKDESLPWDFQIEEDVPLHQNGVEVVVERLTPGATSAFDNSEFLQDLQGAQLQEITCCILGEA